MSSRKNFNKTTTASTCRKQVGDSNSSSDGSLEDDPSRVFTPQFILDQRQKELEKERRESGVIGSRDFSVQEPPSQELTAQYIDDMRQKETERERRSLALDMAGDTTANGVSAATATKVHKGTTVLTPQQFEQIERNRKPAAVAAKPGAYVVKPDAATKKKKTGKTGSGKKTMDTKQAAHQTSADHSSTNGSLEPSGVLSSTQTQHAAPPLVQSKPLHRAAAAGVEPGAHAQPGLNSTMSVSTRSEEYHPESAMEAGLDPVIGRRRQSNGSVEESSKAFSLRGSLLKAQMVDDAEVVVAVDAKVDNFRRKLIIGLVVAVVVCVVAISLVLLLRESPSEGEPACEFEDDFCCTSIDEVPYPRIIPFMCRCFNTTESIYEGLTPDEKEMQRKGWLQNLVAWNVLEQDEADSIDPIGCHPYVQATLVVSQPEKVGLTVEEVLLAPTSAVLDMLAIFVTFLEMGGLEWSQSFGWFEDVDVCSYFGVDCVFVDTLSAIRLPSNGLQGAIPTELGLITSLRELDLSGNTKIIGPLPTQLAAMTSLGTFDLSESPIGGPIPTFLGDMTSLDKLDLASCDLTGTISPAIFKLDSANFLSLSNNHLKGTLSTEFGRFTNLDMLRLDRNSLTGTLPSELMNMENLGLLHVGDNQLSGAFPAFLGLMPKLMLLDVFNSGLTGPIPETFCNDTNVEGGGLRQVVVNCSAVAMCSCCSENGSQGVRVICAELRPEFAIGNL